MIRNRLLLAGLLFIQFVALSAQQSVTQLSDGGSPWTYKFTQYDREINFQELPYVDQAALLIEDEQLNKDKNRRYRFGYDHYVSYNLENSGIWKELENGDFVWRLGISSPNAVALSFSFKSMIVPKGCSLFVMNSAYTEHHGAFNDTYASAETRILSTELLSGDKAVIELMVPAEYRNVVRLELWRVTHAYRDLSALAKAFGDAGACENNARCPAYAAYDDQIRSVVCLVDGGEFCTGALINNTCNDGTPYVLTANHCYSSPATWTFRFNWEAVGCTNPGSSPSTAQSIAVGTLRARDAGSDFCLVQINSAVPAGYNAFWAGWDRNATASTNPYCIHHPSGDIKKFSQSTGTCTTSTQDLGNGPAAVWQTPTWTDGVTEPGSSGFPLFNQSGRIVGQLYGGPSNCGCENNAGCGYDYYGRFNVSWTGGGTNATRLSNWLDPAACATGATTDDGFPLAVALAWDAQITSVTTPTGSYCNGNISPVVVFKNNGTNTITSINISYQIDGGASTNYAWSGSLASGSSVNVSMPAIVVASGAHTYTATASTTINGSQTDLLLTNNASTSNFSVASIVAQNLPFTEGFETATFAPTGWTNENPDNNVGSSLWVRTTTVGGFGNTSACAFIDEVTPTGSTVGQVDNLLTPYLNLTTQTTPINLTFSVANVRYSAAYYDSLVVWITTDCGASWNRIGSYGNNSGPNALATAADNTSAFTPGPTQWGAKTISLNPYSSQTAAQVRFQFISGWGNNTYLDDINISGGSGAGINNNFQEMLNVYPNPANNTVNIDNPTFDGNPYQLYLTNMLGEVIMSTNANTQKLILDISTIASGSYILKVVQNGKEASKKLMIIK